MSAIEKFSSIFYILCLFLSSTAFADAVQKHFDFKSQVPASATAEQHTSPSAQEIKTSSGQFFIGGSKFWEWLINAQTFFCSYSMELPKRLYFLFSKSAELTLKRRVTF